MRSNGGSSSGLSLIIGEDWWTFLSTYPDHTPIFDISAGSMTISLSIADQKGSEAAVQFARELVERTTRFAAEIERIHALKESGTAPGNGEAA